MGITLAHWHWLMASKVLKYSGYMSTNIYPTLYPEVQKIYFFTISFIAYLNEEHSFLLNVNCKVIVCWSQCRQSSNIIQHWSDILTHSNNYKTDIWSTYLVWPYFFLLILDLSWSTWRFHHPSFLFWRGSWPKDNLSSCCHCFWDSLSFQSICWGKDYVGLNSETKDDSLWIYGIFMWVMWHQ